MSRSRAYHHGDLADALESAAMELLANRPAAEISLREVARAADVSHNAPYHHFADRRGLLKVLAERSMADLVNAVDAAIERAAGPARGLRAGGRAYVSFAATRPHAFETIYDPTVCIPGQPTETMAPLIAQLEERLSDLAAGAGIGSPAEVAGIWALMHGNATLAAAGHLTQPAALAAYDSILDRALTAISTD